MVKIWWLAHGYGTATKEESNQQNYSQLFHTSAPFDDDRKEKSELFIILFKKNHPCNNNFDIADPSIPAINSTPEARTG